MKYFLFIDLFFIYISKINFEYQIYFIPQIGSAFLFPTIFFSFLQKTRSGRSLRLVTWRGDPIERQACPQTPADSPVLELERKHQNWITDGHNVLSPKIIENNSTHNNNAVNIQHTPHSTPIFSDYGTKSKIKGGNIQGKDNRCTLLPLVPSFILKIINPPPTITTQQ